MAAGFSLDDLVVGILDSAPEGILLADRDGLILYANPAYSAIVGAPREERVGKNIHATHPEGALSQCLRSGRPVSGVKHRPPHSRVDVLSKAFPIYVQGELVGAVAFFQELTEALHLLEVLSRTQEKAAMLADKLGGVARAPYTWDDLVGAAPAFQQALQVAHKAAAGDSTVLLRGESGTGKELFAAAIHNASRRAARPFIKVNCAAIPENLLESEFFGHEKGAFTGASQRKLGTFELADSGTLFLDEIGDMSLPLQAKLLGVLQNGEFRRVGGTTSQRVDVRVIAATNRPLEQMVQQGSFRGDLYFRLNVISLALPALRQRREDIPLLAEHLMEKIGRRLGRRGLRLSDEALRRLAGYDWPGNVRELENVLERAIALAEPESRVITAREILLPDGAAPGLPDIMPLAELERQMIRRALARFGTSVKGKREAARALQISLTTLYSKLKQGSLSESGNGLQNP